MNAPLTRTEWINLRVGELLLDDEAVPDLFDQIMRHDGLAKLSLLSGLRQWLYGASVFIRERGANQATNVVRAFAWMQASNEYDHQPLIKEAA